MQHIDKHIVKTGLRKMEDIRNGITGRIHTLANLHGGRVHFMEPPVVTVQTEAGPLQVEVPELHLDERNEVEIYAILAADPSEPPYLLSIDQVGLEHLADILAAIPEIPMEDQGKGALPAFPDPFFLAELAGACWRRLYAKLQDSAAVDNEVILFAKEMTAKYADTDWDKEDILETVGRECDELLRRHDAESGKDPVTRVYVGRWDLLPKNGEWDGPLRNLDEKTEAEIAAEVARQKGVLGPETPGSMCSYTEEALVNTYTLAEFEATFNNDLEDSIRTTDYWIKIFS